jgi:hypothetical protein
MLGLRYELMFLKKRTNMNNEIMAITTAMLTPIMGVKNSPSEALIVLSTNNEYMTTDMNHPSVNWLILSPSNRLTRWDVYFVIESCNVMSVTENATPRMVAHPAAIVDRTLLAASVLPANIIDLI